MVFVGVGNKIRESASIIFVYEMLKNYINLYSAAFCVVTTTETPHAS